MVLSGWIQNRRSKVLCLLCSESVIGKGFFAFFNANFLADFLKLHLCQNLCLDIYIIDYKRWI